MRYKKAVVLLVLMLFLICNSAIAAQKWIRQESSYIVNGVIVSYPEKIKFNEDIILEKNFISELPFKKLKSQEKILEKTVRFNITETKPQTKEIGETLNQIVAKKVSPENDKSRKMVFYKRS